jgi:hypothetical protein
MESNLVLGRDGQPVAETWHGLDVGRLRRIWLDLIPKAVHHFSAACRGLPLRAATRDQ